MVWTIAGFDPSSGAGVTADLFVFAAHGLFGCSAITALTVQSTLGVAGVEHVSGRLLRQTLEHLWVDLPPAGIKIGMLGGAEQAEVVGRFLAERREGFSAGERPIVVYDPVLRSSSGRNLYPAGEVAGLRKQMLPWVDAITPNWAELSTLAETPADSVDQVECAARSLLVDCPDLEVVATGGDQTAVTDLLVSADSPTQVFAGERVETRSTHGTGCAFSSALLAGLVHGASMPDSVAAAKRYVAGALRAAPGVGQGKGPMELLWELA